MPIRFHCFESDSDICLSIFLQHRLALAIAERKADRQPKAGRPHRNGAGKKNKRLMLLHGRKSLAGEQNIPLPKVSYGRRSKAIRTSKMIFNEPLEKKGADDQPTTRF